MSKTAPRGRFSRLSDARAAKLHAKISTTINIFMAVSKIQIFAEVHFFERFPDLKFELNGTSLVCQSIIKHSDSPQPFCQRTVFEMTGDIKDGENKLAVILWDKTDQDIHTHSDLWISVKNIIIDAVPAGWLVFQNSVFEHSMPAEWVDDMKMQGITIADSYSPGSDLRINGKMIFNFEQSLWLQYARTWMTVSDVAQ